MTKNSNNARTMRGMFFSIFLFFGMFNCDNGGRKIITDDKSTNKDSSAVNVDDLSGDKFKKWLRDTLGYLNNKRTENPQKEYALLNDFRVGPDSLSITFILNYKVHIDKEKEYNSDISYILDLLKEYNEWPGDFFSLSFTKEHFLYPSVIDRFSYSSVTELSKIFITDKQLVTKFLFNRGRFSEKIEYDENRRSQTTIFTLKGNSIVKNKLKFKENK